MSSAIPYAHADAYKLPAGILALVAHAAFFALLYFGINWQAHPPQGMAVELWSDLPDENVVPQPAPPPAVVVPPESVKPVEPVKPQPSVEKVTPSKAEIELAGKKKKAEEPKPEPKREPTKAELEKAKKEAQQAKKEMQESILQQEQAEQAERQARAKQAEATAAVTSEVGKYKGLIIAKVRRNVVLPPDVEDNAQAEFDVTLLPGGDVFDVKKTKRSGNDAYDSAVERAIWKASPLPVPSDADLFSKNFRKLRLKFRPKD